LLVFVESDYLLMVRAKMAAMNAHNSDGSIIEGASSVFVDALRMGLCALFVFAVLLLLLPRNSRAIEPASDGADFFCIRRSRFGAVCTRGGIATEILSTSSNDCAAI